MYIKWDTHKKLLDAGGLGPVIYILLARGEGRSSLVRERVTKYCNEGRTVVYVEPGNRKRLRSSRKPFSVLDRDILTLEEYERADRIWREYWDDVRKGD